MAEIYPPPVLQNMPHGYAVQDWRIAMVQFGEIMAGADAWLHMYYNPETRRFNVYLARGPKGPSNGTIRGYRETRRRWVWKEGVSPSFQKGYWKHPRQKTARWGHWEDYEVNLVSFDRAPTVKSSLWPIGYMWIPTYSLTDDSELLDATGTSKVVTPASELLAMAG